MTQTRPPQILYWFWTAETIQDEKYLSDLDYLTDHSPFDLIFLTQRQGMNFYDYEKMHPHFAALVARAAEKGVGIGLQLWPRALEERDIAQLGNEIRQCLVVDGNYTLDNKGRASFTQRARFGREYLSCGARLLAAYAYEAAGKDEYKAGSLTDISHCGQLQPWQAGEEHANSIICNIDAGAERAGKQVFVMTAHEYPYGDLYGDFFPESFREALEAYGDIPFQGVGLDEFGHMGVTPPWRLEESASMDERMYSLPMARTFQEATGHDLTQTLLDMRLSPEGKGEVRAAAINRYFAHLRTGPLKTEEAFAKDAQRLFGKDVFLGVHNTFHNRLHSDEIWITGLQWWTLPRRWGQTDEDIGMPVRMGVACSCPEPLHYDMFYTKDVERFYTKAIYDAPFGGRLHYHAVNDQYWGHSLEDPAFLERISPIEKKIALLNQFEPARPAMDLLIIFGMPALSNWYPDHNRRSNYDLNTAVTAQKDADEIWKAGFPCALVPSDLVDNGRIQLSEDGSVTLGGHRFRHVAWLSPQYATEPSLRFLEQLTQADGKLILVGDATQDFEAQDIRARMDAIAAKAAAKTLDPETLDQLGVWKNDVEKGCRLADGSVVVSDLTSIETDTPCAFRVEIGGRTWSGDFIGTMALKVGSDGEVEKFACGGFQALQRDGQSVLSVDTRNDVVLCNGQLQQAQ